MIVQNDDLHKILNYFLLAAIPFKVLVFHYPLYDKVFDGGAATCEDKMKTNGFCRADVDDDDLVVFAPSSLGDENTSISHLCFLLLAILGNCSFEGRLCLTSWNSQAHMPYFF